MTQQNPSITIQNLEAAFAGESMAHIKYRYFAKLAREGKLSASEGSVRDLVLGQGS